MSGPWPLPALYPVSLVGRWGKYLGGLDSKPTECGGEMGASRGVRWEG